MPKALGRKSGTSEKGGRFLDRREQVLRTAARMFRVNGVDATSTGEIAKELQITKPTLYYYISSKDDLLADIQVFAQDEILCFMQEAIATDLSGYEKLRAMMINYVEVVASDFGACLVMTWNKTLEDRHRQQLDERISKGRDLIVDAINQGRDDGSLQIRDVTITYQALFGSLNWGASWYKPDGRLSVKELAETHVDVLLDGVRGHGS